MKKEKDISVWFPDFPEETLSEIVDKLNSGELLMRDLIKDYPLVSLKSSL